MWKIYQYEFNQNLIYFPNQFDDLLAILINYSLVKKNKWLGKCLVQKKIANKINKISVFVQSTEVKLVQWLINFNQIFHNKLFPSFSLILKLNVFFIMFLFH